MEAENLKIQHILVEYLSLKKLTKGKLKFSIVVSNLFGLSLRK